MKKSIFTFIGALALVWSVNAIPALAINVRDGLEDASGDIGAGYNTSLELPELIGSIIAVLLSILGVLFLILTIYAGFLWMTAAGEEKKVQKAKDILRAAIIGLVLILSAYGIADFVVNALQRSV